MDRQAGVVHLLMELGEIDLNQLLQSYKSQEQNSTTRHPSRSTHTAAGLEVNFVRIVWQQMLEAVDAMHEQRVVHSDLKPANFVFCRGTLKLIDFGIAKIISNNTTNISRDSQVGTLNYMCPEAILDTGKGEVRCYSKRCCSQLPSTLLLSKALMTQHAYSYLFRRSIPKQAKEGHL